MDEDVEMDALNKDDSSKPLLDTPEVAVLQPDRQKRRRSEDSPIEIKERQDVPLDEEPVITPVEAESINKRLHCAGVSPLDSYHYRYRDHLDFDDVPSYGFLDTPLESYIPQPEKSSAIPALDRFEPAVDTYGPVCNRAARPAIEGVAPVARVEEKLIIPEKIDGGLVDRQEDLKKNEDRLSLQDRLKFEKEMDEILEDKDLDDISEWITPQNLTKCATNCLEKSLEVSHTLKSLADGKGPDADDMKALGTSVEEFAVQLLEPLKSDDLKRAIFEGEDFDRVSDKAVKYQQKKFVSHPVVYNLLTRQRWMGHLDRVRYDKNWFKWFLLNVWTFFDVLLFPLVHLFLWLIHLIIQFAKKRQELRVVFLFNAKWKYADVQLPAMQDTAKYIMHHLKSDRVHCASITLDRDGPIVREFTKGAINMPKAKNVRRPIREVSRDKDVKDDAGFLDCLEKAKNLFENTEESKKVLVVMTDDKIGAPSIKFLKSIKQEQNLGVISVGFGVHPQIKELETMATRQENIFLIFNDGCNADKRKKANILKCIKGKDIYDRYFEYFTTPYFIFFRDTLSYLALLGLHFAMCLQPSTVHFTVVEWIISVFFLGRLMMEIHQVIMEKNSDWKDDSVLSTQENEAKQMLKEEENEEENEEEEEKENEEETENFASAKDAEEEEKEDKKDKNQKTKELPKLWRIILSYFDDWWNILDIATLIVFLILVGLRAFIWSQHSSISKNRLLAVAGYLYGLNAMFLTLRVFGHIMESKKSTGSIQIALFQIITAVVAIFGQFIAATVAFSLAITKIYVAEVSYNSGTNGTSSELCGSQNGISCWWGFTKYLTWSLLGIAELTPLQSSDDTSDVLAKILYGLFLIMGVVMLMNMMIALLSNTYQHVEDNAFYEWSYKKATTIRTYTKYHPVPVPFNIISLSFILLRHICRKIKCTKCKRNKPRHEAPKPIRLTCKPVISIEKFKKSKKRTKKEKQSLFDSLIQDLQAEYFAVYGYAFPMADDNKMDVVLKETEGCHQLIGHIAQRAFRYDQGERKRLESHGNPDWDTKGIDVIGQRLVHVSCQCQTCVYEGEVKHHGAKYLNPLSTEYPAFEVLIQESGERRFIAIGVVTKHYEIHRFPGWEGNTAGYHIDDGNIFDSDHSQLGKEGDDAMAHRGDLIGCKILYDQQKDGKLPVSFTLNGRVVGEAKLTYHAGYSTDTFYPFVGIGCKGISLLFRMCPKVSLSRADTDPVLAMLKTISEQQQFLSEQYQMMTMQQQSVSKQLNMMSKEQQMTFEQLRMMNERQTELEWKMDCLSRSSVPQ